MKTKKLIILALGISSLTTLPLMADGVKVEVGIPAPVVVTPPVVVAPPAVTVETTVPDNYVWDGTEYVGVVGSHYYYLGPHDVWLTMDAPRLTRFHGWEHDHGDWRTHAIRNSRYRNDAHGHAVPMREEHHEAEHHDADHHDNDHHDDHR
jgi:hypothetical protein